MNQHLKILHLEDLPTDAQLVERELKKGNIKFNKLVVDNRIDFIKAMDEFQPDIILSDHSLPSFNSTEALSIVKEKKVTVPFILITATISEEFAVEVMKGGAYDYILKDRLQRLPQAINNALEKHRIETERQQFLERVIANELLLKETEQLATIGSFKADLVNNTVQWSGELRRILGLEDESIEPSLENLLKRVHPGDKERIKTELENALVKSNSLSREFRIIMDDGSLKHIRSELVIERDENKEPVSIRGFNQDITAQKKAEEKIIKANRLYSFISAINQSIVHISDEQKLFNKVCNIAVEIGQFKSASVVLLDENDILKLLSAQGDEALAKLINKYSGLHLTDPALTNSTAGKVLMTGRYVVNNDSLSTPVEDVKDVIIEHGIKSNISFPIKKFSKVIGVFNLISSIKNFFDESEIALLEEAAGDISFALEVIEKDKLRKQAEALLLQNETRLKKAQRIAHIGHWELDFASGMSTWSEESCRIYGLDPENNRHSFEEWTSFLHPDDVDFTMKIIKEQQQSLSKTSFVHRIIRKDGTTRYIHAESKFEFDSTGKPYALYGVSHDITEQKLSEEKLKESEARLKEAQAIALVGSWEIDLVSNSLYWSDEQFLLLGLKREQVAPSNELFFSMVHPDDFEIINAEFNNTFQTFENSSRNFRMILKDETIKHVYCEWKFEFDGNKKPLRIYGIVQDVTERKLAEEERTKIINDMIQRNNDLEQFSYIVSHNLRAPVANIIGLTDLINSFSLSENDRKTIIAGLNTSTHRLDTVIMDLNQILQIRKQVDERREDIRFSEVLYDIRQSIDNLIKKEDVHLKLNFSEVDKLHSIKSYIHSIFYNLITNSIKYKREGVPTQIEIKSDNYKNKILLTYKDNGMGIDLEKNGKQIFGLYKRFHNQAEGKGMGLYMVKTQVEALGGRINITSEVNKGTEFKIELENFTETV